MTRGSGTYIFVNGKRYDLAAPMAVEALLRIRKGRRALACWLNDHRNSAQYAPVYDRVAGAVLGRHDLFKPLTAAATVAACLLAPAASLPFSIPQDAAKQCVLCHTAPAAPSGTIKAVAFQKEEAAAPQKLAFFSLGSAGYGVTGIGRPYLLSGEENESAGVVNARGVLFRNESGTRLRCELGSAVPRGASVVLGTKAYLLKRNGAEWTMRNIVRLNGTALRDEVFIAEHYVKRARQKERVLQASSAPAPASSAARPAVAVAVAASFRPAEHAPAASAAPTAPPAPAVPVVTAGAVRVFAPSRAVVARAADTAVAGAAGGPVTVERKGDVYEAVSHFGGLTITHVFRGSGAMTVHEASLAAYPELSFLEAFNVPLEETIKNVAKYSRGVDNQLGKNIVAFVNNTLAPLFADNRLRRLPAPDNRLVLGIKIAGADEYYKHLYLGTASGEWLPLSDDLLTGLLSSDPVASYAEHASQ